MIGESNPLQRNNEKNLQSEEHGGKLKTHQESKGHNIQTETHGGCGPDKVGNTHQESQKLGENKAEYKSQGKITGDKNHLKSEGHGG